METLTCLFRILCVSIFIFNCTIANSQNSDTASDSKFSEMIAKYENSKDRLALNYLYVLGANNEKVLEWFENNLSSDLNVLYAAGQAFARSKLLPWSSKAEKTLIRSLELNPKAHTANTLGDIYLKKDSRKACEIFEKAYKIESNNIGNEEFAFCLMPDVTDRSFRKSDAEACEIIKIISKEYIDLFGKNESWEAGRVFYFHGECLSSNKSDLSKIKNTREAVEWYKRGMNSGHDWSAFTYAEHLESGIGVLRDPKGALQAYNKAATLGLNVAQNRLGIIYAEGELVPKNIPEAYKWFLIATANGYEPAKDNRIRSESRLSRVEIRSAENLAKQWLKENQ
jgi:TPR repeat protein